MRFLVPVERFSLFLFVILHLVLLERCRASDRISERHSYSLTTFDPSGKLGQVERAILASSRGSPIVGLVRPDGVLLSSPQVLPSILMEDDGTSRFSMISPEIMIGHSGLSADGRVMVSAAQRIAVEHEYTFDEDIPIGIFLEELSLLFQEYTMTIAARPFGAVVVIAYVPSEGRRVLSGGGACRPQIYHIDPSGSVTSFAEGFALINGNLEKTDLPSDLRDLAQNCEKHSLEESRNFLVQSLRNALAEQARKKRIERAPGLTILSSSLSTDGCFRLRRHNS